MTERFAYKARRVCPAVNLTDEQATAIALELAPLQVDGGHFRQLPARAIVEHARDANSALHGIIWGRDDAALAYETRCQLARQVVQSIRIVDSDEDGEFAKPLAVTVRIEPNAKPGYVPTDVAAASGYMSAQIEQRAITRLRGWLDEFRAFRHGSIGPLWDAVQSAVAQSEMPKSGSVPVAPPANQTTALAVGET